MKKLILCMMLVLSGCSYYDPYGHIQENDTSFMAFLGFVFLAFLAVGAIICVVGTLHEHWEWRAEVDRKLAARRKK